MNQRKPDDIIDVVTAQHHQVAAMLDAVQQASPADRAGKFQSLVDFVGAHERAEEEAIYPVLRGLGSRGASIADDRVAEEEKATQEVAKLQHMDAASNEFAAAFAMFSAAVHRHAETEEDLVLGMLRDSLPDGERADMAAHFLAVEDKIHSH